MRTSPTSSATGVSARPRESRLTIGTGEETTRPPARQPAGLGVVPSRSRRIPSPREEGPRSLRHHPAPRHFVSPWGQGTSPHRRIRLPVAVGERQGTTTYYHSERTFVSPESHVCTFWTRYEGCGLYGPLHHEPRHRLFAEGGVRGVLTREAEVGVHPGGAPRMFRGVTEDRHASESRAFQGVSMIVVLVFPPLTRPAAAGPSSASVFHLLPIPEPPRLGVGCFRRFRE